MIGISIALPKGESSMVRAADTGTPGLAVHRHKVALTVATALGEVLDWTEGERAIRACVKLHPRVKAQVEEILKAGGGDVS